MANTSRPLSETAIANMAAQVLDDIPLVSLDDDTVVGRFASRQFGYVRDEVLRTYPWSFAKGRKVLTPNADKPEFDWAYAYTLPDDCLRLIELRRSGTFNATPTTPYELEGRNVLTNVGPSLGIIYIKRVTDPTKFDPLFARVLGYTMAVMVAQTVTGKLSYTDKARAMLADATFAATHADSLERGTQEDTEISSSSAFITVRGY